MVDRKCKDCYYLERAYNKHTPWCWWKGEFRKPNADECSDGFKPKNERTWP